MEWKYEFTNRPDNIDNCIAQWRNILLYHQNLHTKKIKNSLLIEKYTVIFDLNESTGATFNNMMKIVAFIASNKKKIKSQTEKVKILITTDKQGQMLERIFKVAPYLVEFEVVKKTQCEDKDMQSLEK